MSDVKVHSIYRHFKGDYYLVEGIATNSETNEKYVVYRALYDNLELYVRPLSMFIDKVDKDKYPDIEQEFRYELQDIGSARNEFLKANSKEISNKN